MCGRMRVYIDNVLM